MGLTKLIVTFLMVTPLIGCGSSNPVSEYNLKTVPKHGRAQPTQTVALSPFLFNIKDGVPPNFTDGEEGILTFQVRADQAVTNYVLQPLNLPSGARLKQLDFNTWQLQWKPNQILAANIQYVFFDLEFELVVTQASDARYLRLSSRPDPIRLFVLRNGTPPSITAIRRLPEKVKNGESSKFEVEVNDPGALGATPPTLQVLSAGRAQSRGNYKADGAPFVAKATEPKALGPGRWQYSLVFDTQISEVPSINSKGQPDSSVETLPTCFEFKIQSPSGLSSPEYLNCVQILFQPDVPTVQWPTESTKILIGRRNTLSFGISVPARRGELVALNLSEQFDTWPGNPSMECKPVSSRSQRSLKCTLNWTLNCDVQALTNYVLKVRSTHKVLDEVVTQDFERDISVASSERLCPKAGEAAAAKSSAKGDVK